jgi:DNA polymerase I
MTKKLFVVDAMAMAFRNFYAFGNRPLTTASGQPTSAVFGSAIFMNKLINDHNPDYLVIATDTKQPTFRHKLYKEYKANRSEMPEELAAQLDSFYKLFECYGIPVIKCPGFEADDIIGSITAQFIKEDLEIYMVSADKDFMQLINEQVFLYTPKKGGETAIIDIEGVNEKFGVKPDQIIDMLAIMGDAADNVPGVYGIGEKGAAKLIQAYGSLDGIYENLDKITAKRQLNGLTEHKKEAYLSQELVTIKCDMDLGCSLEDFACDSQNVIANEALLKFYEEMEFVGLTKKVRTALGTTENESPPPTPVKKVTTKDKIEKNSAIPEGELFPVTPTAKVSEDANYILVDSKDKLKNALESLSAGTELCFDTETTGLDIIHDKPIGLSFSCKAGEAFYFPIVEKHLSNVSPEEMILASKKLLENTEITKIAHNAKFDIQMLQNVDINCVGPFADTMIEDHILDSTARSHSLDACCLRHLDYEKIPTTELIGKKGEIPMLDAPLDLLSKYACEDADLTFQLHSFLYPKLKEENLLAVYHHVEIPLIPIIAEMEKAGVYIDSNDLNRFSMTLGAMLDKLTKTIHDLAGEEFNIKSPKQLQVILFEKLKIHDELGIKKLKKTKTGFSTNEAVLNTLSAHPLPNAILEYRGVVKLKNTYVDVLPTLVDEKTGRVHTSFHQVGTATGRMSSTEPNLQNIPIRSDLGKEIRKTFKAQDKDSVIVSADYSQVELRILAHIAGEGNLMDAFNEGVDVHTATAAKVFGIKEEEVDPNMRSQAKAINFGIIYGMGPKRLATETGVTMKEASAFIKKYFEGYPGIKNFINSSKDSARDTEMTYSLTGRRRPVPAINGSDRMALAMAENVAVNTPIQGSAADLIKLAMIKLDKVMKEKKLKSKMLLQVHDELVFEVKKVELTEMSKIIKESMETAMALKVPLRVDIGAGANWLEAH